MERVRRIWRRRWSGRERRGRVRPPAAVVGQRGRWIRGRIRFGA